MISFVQKRGIKAGIKEGIKGDIKRYKRKPATPAFLHRLTCPSLVKNRRLSLLNHTAIKPPT